MEIQEQVLPQGRRVNQLLDFMGCTANIVYIQRSTEKVFIANLGDSKALYLLDENQNKTFIQLSKTHELGDPLEQ